MSLPNSIVGLAVQADMPLHLQLHIVANGSYPFGLQPFKMWFPLTPPT